MISIIRTKSFCPQMSLSVDDDVREPDLAAVVRIIMLAISVIFGLFRSKVEDLLRGRPEHMELLQSVYRELSVAAMISMFLSLIGSSSVTADISRSLGFQDADRVTETLHSLHIVFLVGMMLYMAMCATIMGTLRIVVNTLKRWDDQTIQSGVAEMQELLDHISVDVDFPILQVLFRSFHIMYAKRKLAWLMYREVFFMQFVSDSEDSPSDFSYVRYLRLAIYEVCLQLTEIRGAAGVILLILVLLRWARVRWEVLSFIYVYHVNSRIMSMCQEYLIDTRKFSRKNLRDFRERVERFGLHETVQTHDSFNAPKIVVDKDQDSVIESRVVPAKQERMSQSVIESWMQHKALRERRREELVRIAAGKFANLSAMKAKYQPNNVAPESANSPEGRTTAKSDDGLKKQRDTRITHKMSGLSIKSADERGHSLHLGRHTQTGMSVANFRMVSAKIAEKLSVMRDRMRRKALSQVSPDNMTFSQTIGDGDEKRPGDHSAEFVPSQLERPCQNESQTARGQASTQQAPQSSPRAEAPRRASDADATRRMIPHSQSSNTPRHSIGPENAQRLVLKRMQEAPVHLSVLSASEVPGHMPQLPFGNDPGPRRSSQPSLPPPADHEMGRKGSQSQTPRRLSLSLSAANASNHASNSGAKERVLTPRYRSQNSDNENSVSRSASHRDDSPSAMDAHMEDPYSGIGSKSDNSPSRKGSAHQDGHHGFRQSVRKSLKMPADEIARKHELDRRRSTSLRDHMRQASESNLHLAGITHKRHLYTYRLIASFGGSKLEQAQGDDLENSFRWWASPGAQGLMTILHSMVLIDTLMFGMTLYLFSTGDKIELIAIMIPLALKMLLAPILIQNYTMITSSGSMARIELLLLAIHQKLEEEAMAQLSQAEQTRISRHR